MEINKLVEIRLFYNLSDRMMYVMVGSSLFRISDKVAAAIQEKEKIEIVYAQDSKHMQILANDK